MTHATPFTAGSARGSGKPCRWTDRSVRGRSSSAAEISRSCLWRVSPPRSSRPSSWLALSIQPVPRRGWCACRTGTTDPGPSSPSRLKGPARRARATKSGSRTVTPRSRAERSRSTAACRRPDPCRPRLPAGPTGSRSPAAWTSGAAATVRGTRPADWSPAPAVGAPSALDSGFRVDAAHQLFAEVRAQRLYPQPQASLSTEQRQRSRRLHSNPNTG